ncbi:MAG: pseudouridine synthase, partial [Clostridia bacterium]
NDGTFADRIMHPAGEINKIYIVNVEGAIKESELAVMRSGIVLENGERMPSCRIVFKKFEENVTRLEITINEGQNRQIRRMFEAIGKSIILLKRIQIGEIKLGGLSRGEYKDLTSEEITSIMD